MPSDRHVRALLEGGGCFTDDVRVPGALHAAFVRSPEAHARLVGVDAAPAEAVAGVVAVFTAADLDPLGAFPVFVDVPGVPPEAVHAPARPALAGDTCRFVGELVAVVVAETAAAALDGAEAVGLDLAPLPAVTRAGATTPALHAEVADNCVLRHRFGDRAAVDDAFARAARVVTLEVVLPRVVPNALEPRAAIADYDAARGHWTLWTPHQGINEIRRSLAPVLDIAPERLDVRAHHVGGAFGARGPAYPEHAVLLAASRRLGRPVRWQGSRLEGFQSEMHGRGTRARGRLGLDAVGRFTALEIAYGADLGAYVTPVGAQIHLKNPQATLTGVYAIPAAVLDVALHLTNTVPTGPYRGAGRPDITYALERLVDEAAAVTGLDRLELRRRNAVAPTNSPWTTPLGVTYDSGDYPGLVDRAARAADWAGAPARRRVAEARGRLHGIGCALFVEVAGGGAAPHDEAVLRLDGTGGALRVAAFVAGKGSGQGHEVTMPRLVAEALGCARAQVELHESARDVPLVGSGTFGSRSLAAMGTALVDAAGTARRELLAVAADAFGRPVERLDVVDGVVVDHGEAVAPLAEIVATAVQGGGVLEVRGRAPRFRTFPSGCHVAEVEVDRDTGAVTLVGYTAVDDSGRVVDHAVVDGQIRGGVVQGIGEALGEAVVYDAGDGQLLTASFVDYAVPRAKDVPAIAVADAGVPSPANPLGAKGVGEAGTTGAPAALANAVVDALRSAGAGPLDMPFSPARVWAALEGDR